MPILSGDVKLVASAVMDDVPEGGGAPTANVIQDGTSNAIGPVLTSLDQSDLGGIDGRMLLRPIARIAPPQYGSDQRDWCEGQEREPPAVLTHQPWQQ